MQLYPIVIVAVVLAADNLSYNLAPALGLNGWMVSAIALGLPALLLFILWWMTRRAARTAITKKSLRPILMINGWSRTTRWLIVAAHALVILVFGWMETLRDAMGDLLLVEEFIAILPPLVGIALTWWVDYPIEKRLRDAMLLGRLDRGLAVHETPKRWPFVWMQMRLQILPLLAPLLLIAAIGEIIRYEATGIENQDVRFWVSEGATMAAAAGVFIIAPFLARILLSVRRLEDGPLRETLLNVCRAHRVKVRDVLVWNTGGVMINAAVMGLFGRLRYVLMTDALLESMERPQLLAVMAHEVGHARKHHMPWMVATMLAALIVTTFVVAAPILFLEYYSMPDLSRSTWLQTPMTIAALVMAFVIFGWVSRRFERQADTFAVAHLSEHGGAMADQLKKSETTAPESNDGDEADFEAALIPSAAVEKYNGHVTASAVHAMQGALESVAQLNMIDTERKSWRHGSIAWRQQYLHQLIGQPVNKLPIDRTVGWIKLTAAAVLVMAISFQAAWAVLIEMRRHQRAARIEESVFVQPGEPNMSNMLLAVRSESETSE